MDKNQILGLLLMGAVVLGFMYLNKPTEGQEEAAGAQAEQQAAQAAQKEQGAMPLSIDSITPAEAQTIAQTVRELGARDSVGGGYALDIQGMELRLNASGELGGTVRAAGAEVPVADMVANRWGKMQASTSIAALEALRSGLRDAARYRGFARCLAGDSATVRLANDVLTLDLSNKGGAIARATLNRYMSYDSSRVEVMSPATGGYGFTLTSATQRFDTREFYFTPVAEGDTAVTMQLRLGDGVYWGLRYTLRPGSYLVTMDVVQQGMEAVIPRSVASMDFEWSQKMRRNEAGRVFEERNSAMYYMFPDGSVDNLSEGSDDDEDMNQRVKWIGCKNQFFSAIVMARSNFASARLASSVLKDDPEFLKQLSAQTTVEYSPSLARPASFTFYLGPNSYPLLKSVEKTVFPEEDMHLTRLIPLGWKAFRWINTLIVIPVFTFLGQWISSYGLIIFLLTVFIKIILFPFTFKSFKSQARMRLLAPEIKAINDKWPGQENAMKRQQETMALYSRAGASPFSGCLPMLLQMPILIAMFNFFPSAIELRGQSFLWVKDLSAPDAIISWSANIPFISSTFGNHVSLFCLLMTVTNILYMRLTMQSQSSQMPGMNMKLMNYLMPLMFLFFFNNYAAGLSYYYFLSLIISIIQTYVTRRLVSEDKMRAQMAENAKKPKKKSGFMARLEEAQRQQQAMLREQQRRQGKK